MNSIYAFLQQQQQQQRQQIQIQRQLISEDTFLRLLRADVTETEK